MYNIITYFIMPICLGHIIGKIFKNTDQIAFNSFLAFYAMPFFAILFNVIFGIGLTQIAIGFALLALIALPFLIFENKNNIKDYLSHPIFIYGLPLILLNLIFGNKYEARSWDEFSHWLTMPKQIFLHDTFYHKDFLIKGFTSYTPGWPFLLILKDLIFESFFNVEKILVVPLCSLVFLFGTLYEVLRLKITDKVHINSILVILFCTFIPTKFINENVLIEIPMVHILCFFSLYLIKIKKQINYKDMLILGLIVSFGYGLKHTYITLVPILLFIPIAQNFFIEGKKINFLNLRKNLDLIIVSILPFLLVYSVWKFNIRYNEIITIFEPKFVDFNSLVSLILERSVIPKKMLVRTFKMASSKEFLLVWMFIPFLIILKKRAKNLPALCLFTYFCFYLLCLTWMYFTSFGTYEATRIASFPRYMSIPLTGICFYSSIYFLSKKEFNNILRKNPLLKIILARPYIFVTCFFLFIATSFYIKQFSHPELINHTNKIKELAHLHNIENTRFLPIHQGGNDLIGNIAIYMSVGDTKYNFKVIRGSSFGEKKDNVWRQIITKKNLQKHFLKNSDILIIEKTDDWLNSALSEITSKECANSPEDYIFINKGDSFACEAY